MKVKIVNCSGELYWYRNKIGKVTEVNFAKKRDRYIYSFREKLINLLELEDTRLSNNHLGFILLWRDIRFAPFSKLSPIEEMKDGEDLHHLSLNERW